MVECLAILATSEGCLRGAAAAWSTIVTSGAPCKHTGSHWWRWRAACSHRRGAMTGGSCNASCRSLLGVTPGNLLERELCSYLMLARLLRGLIPTHSDENSAPCQAAQLGSCVNQACECLLLCNTAPHTHSSKLPTVHAGAAASDECIPGACPGCQPAYEPHRCCWMLHGAARVNFLPIR